MLTKKHRYEHAQPGGGMSSGMPPPGQESTGPNDGPDDPPANAPAAAPIDPATPAAAPVSHETPPVEPVGLVSTKPSESTWYESLPQDLQEFEGLKRFDSPEALARSYVNLESMKGASIRIPGEDASTEARGEFTDKLIEQVPELMYRPDLVDEENRLQFLRTLGMPDSPEKYIDPKLDDLPDDQQIKDSTGFRQVAHEAGLTNEQYQHISSQVARSQNADRLTQIKSFNDDAQALRKKWGQAYDERYRQAETIFRKTGAPEWLSSMFDSESVHPDFIEWGQKLAQQFGAEGSELLNQGAGGDNVGVTPSDAQAKINEIMNNKEHPYWISSHPQNQAAIMGMLELQKQANPSLSTDPATLHGGRGLSQPIPE